MTNKISKKVFGAIFLIKFYAFLTTITSLFNINVYLKIKKYRKKNLLKLEKKLFLISFKDN